MWRCEPPPPEDLRPCPSPGPWLCRCTACFGDPALPAPPPLTRLCRLKLTVRLTGMSSMDDESLAARSSASPPVYAA